MSYVTPEYYSDQIDKIIDLFNDPQNISQFPMKGTSIAHLLYVNHLMIPKGVKNLVDQNILRPLDHGAGDHLYELVNPRMNYDDLYYLNDSLKNTISDQKSEITFLTDEIHKLKDALRNKEARFVLMNGYIDKIEVDYRRDTFYLKSQIKSNDLKLQSEVNQIRINYQQEIDELKKNFRSEKFDLKNEQLKITQEKEDLMKQLKSFQRIPGGLVSQQISDVDPLDTAEPIGSSLAGACERVQKDLNKVSKKRKSSNDDSIPVRRSARLCN